MRITRAVLDAIALNPEIFGNRAIARVVGCSPAQVRVALSSLASRGIIARDYQAKEITILREIDRPGPRFSLKPLDKEILRMAEAAGESGITIKETSTLLGITFASAQNRLNRLDKHGCIVKVVRRSTGLRNWYAYKSVPAKAIEIQDILRLNPELKSTYQSIKQSWGRESAERYLESQAKNYGGRTA